MVMMAIWCRIGLWPGAAVRKFAAVVKERAMGSIAFALLLYDKGICAVLGSLLLFSSTPKSDADLERGLC